jgi:hypothetical protein
MLAVTGALPSRGLRGTAVARRGAVRKHRNRIIAVSQRLSHRARSPRTTRRRALSLALFGSLLRASSPPGRQSPSGSLPQAVSLRQSPSGSLPQAVSLRQSPSGRRARATSLAPLAPPPLAPPPLAPPPLAPPPLAPPATRPSSHSLLQPLAPPATRSSATGSCDGGTDRDTGFKRRLHHDAGASSCFKAHASPQARSLHGSAAHVPVRSENDGCRWMLLRTQRGD